MGFFFLYVDASTRTFLMAVSAGSIVVGSLIFRRSMNKVRLANDIAKGAKPVSMECRILRLRNKNTQQIIQKIEFMVKSVNNLPDGGICYQIDGNFLLFNFEFLNSLFLSAAYHFFFCVLRVRVRVWKSNLELPQTLSVASLPFTNVCLFLSFSVCTARANNTAHFCYSKST